MQPFNLADATLPLPAGDPDLSGSEEDRLISNSGASFTYGIALSGWSDPSATYFHPFGSIGADFGPVSFQQVIMRLRTEGAPQRFANYSLAAMAAQAGRFQRPGRNPRSVLSTLEYGLHVDCANLAAIEQDVAEAGGVERVPGRLDLVEYRDDGSIAALRTVDDQRIEGDLFLDSSGVEALLIAPMAGNGWEDWSDWLPCDRLVSAEIQEAEATLPYSHAEANPAGWTQYLSLPGRTVVNSLYRADAENEEHILDRFREFAGGGKIVNLQSAPLLFGRRKKIWQHNCLALGAAAALIDPIGVSNLQLLRAGINRMLTLLPGVSGTMTEAIEYNRQTDAHLSHARDFGLLHYLLNGRRGEAVWDHCRKMAIPASLAYKLQLYSSIGRVALYDHEPLDDISWINLFDEHGVRPQRLHPIAQAIDVPELQKHAERIRALMVDTLRKMPVHDEYLAGLRPNNTN